MLATYLLVKGSHTYVNLLSYGQNVQWLPEYSINLGAATDPPPVNVAGLFNPAWSVYARRYRNGLVLVNPSLAPSGEIQLDRTYLSVTPSGGGIVPADGGAPGQLSYATVNRISLCAHCAAILLETGPVIAADSVVNAASGIGGTVAPGEFVAIYGSGLGPATPVTSGFVEKGLGGVRVLFDDTEAFLSYSAAGQINAVAPYGLTPGEITAVRVEYEDRRSTPVNLLVAASAPGIFTMNGSGSGQAVVVNQDLTFNSAARPASKGSVVALWLTGQGAVNPAGADGRAPVIPPYSMPAAALQVTLGGRTLGPEAIDFAGLVYLGVTQVNVRIPVDAPSGSSIEIRIGAVNEPSSRPGTTLVIM